MANTPSSRDREGEAAQRALAEFAAGFRRSRKGNLWRRYEGMMVTVYRRPRGGDYGWSITVEAGADETAENKPKFSPTGYRTAAEATAALWEKLEYFAAD